MGAECHLQMMQNVHGFAMIRQDTVQTMQQVPSPLKAEKAGQNIEKHSKMQLSALKMLLHFSFSGLTYLRTGGGRSRSTSFFCFLRARQAQGREGGCRMSCADVAKCPWICNDSSGHGAENATSTKPCEGAEGRAKYCCKTELSSASIFFCIEVGTPDKQKSEKAE